MPFPWKKKKTRVNRISQIVADLQSPKRGGSLVVQTGFPTSLIDLFVKNRSRFARPKPKKPVQPEIPDPPPPLPSLAVSPPPQIPTHPLAEAQTPGSLTRENVIATVDVGSGRDRKCISGSGLGYRVVDVAVRILVVVVLIASVKSFTVGITVSAFALLLLEYAAKRPVSCSMPRSNVAVEYLAQRAYACFRFQNLLLLRNKPKEEESELGNFQVEAELRSGSLLLDEIEVVETVCIESSSVIQPELSLIGGGKKWGYSELVEEVEGNGDDDSSKGRVVVEASSSCEASRVRRSSFGFKSSRMMKKLVHKKFWVSKKERNTEKMDKEGEAESWSEDKSTSFEIKKEAPNVGKQGESEGIRDDNGDDEVEFRITGSEESSSMEREGYEGQRIGRVGNSEYRVLVVIALVGLLVGRLQALILIMAWCFMLKIVKILWRTQSEDVPKVMIKCSVPELLMVQH